MKSINSNFVSWKLGSIICDVLSEHISDILFERIWSNWKDSDHYHKGIDEKIFLDLNIFKVN